MEAPPLWVTKLQRLQELDFQAARTELKEWLHPTSENPSSPLEAFLASPAVAGIFFPIAVLPPALGECIGSLPSAHVVVVSHYTIQKQKKHDDTPITVLYQIQRIIDEGEAIKDWREHYARHLLFFLKRGRAGDKYIKVTIKSTTAGKELFLQSYHQVNTARLEHHRQHGTLIRPPPILDEILDDTEEPMSRFDPFTLKKTHNLQGTFNPSAFYLSLLPHYNLNTNSWEFNKDADNTPAIQVFDVLGFHCIPHVGVYGEDYYPAIPLFLLALPPSRNLLSPQLLPSTLLHAINFDHLKEIYVMIHPYIEPSPCQHFICEESMEINLMYHPWVYQDVEFSQELDVTTQIEVGLFGCHGVRETHMKSKEEEAGVPFDRLGKRTVTIHYASFSPLNCQVMREMNSNFHAFFSLARKEGNHQALCYHILLGSQKVEDLFNKAIAQADSLNEALTAMMKCADEIEGLILPPSTAGGLCDALNTINKLVITLNDK